MSKIAIHSVFIVKENILFLEEWIDYHIQIGVDAFYLYDNSKVEKRTGIDAHKKHMIPGKVNKYNINFDKVVNLTDEQINEVLNKIKDKYNGILNIIEWSRRDAGGKVCYFQEEAHKDCHNRLKEANIEWCVSIDLDEFIVLKDQMLKDYLTSLKSDISSVLLSQIEFESRFSNIGKPIVEINKMNEIIPEMNKATKYIYRVKNAKQLKVHVCSHSGKQIHPPTNVIWFNHYKIYFKDNNNCKIIQPNMNKDIIFKITENFKNYFINSIPTNVS